MKLTIFLMGFAICCAVCLIDSKAALAVSQEQQIADWAESVFCPNCFKKNKPHSKFCWNDGFPLPESNRVQQTGNGKTESRDDVVSPRLRLSDIQLHLLAERVADRLEARGVVGSSDSGLVGSMTRAEFESLVKDAVREHNVAYQADKPSGFGSFLEFVGGVTLAVVGIGLIAAAGD
ncbi:MAG: hypothetical protein JSW58_16085 [Candidatus Latescibacterota bacterium]|nr:MAG: hypothetical protein JSW58_16085 [Candidatus Latescibacterota bacterium]